MEDLIERVTKYAKSAGRTGIGHYDAAHKNEFNSKWLLWINVSLTAIVGTSVFSNLVEVLPILTGAVAFIAAAIAAIQASSKFGESASRHRTAGARYGGLRRRADLLKLKIAGIDIDRETALAELESLGQELSMLAEDCPSLPDSIYYPAKAKFDKDHKEYSYKTYGRDVLFTHAGGVVFRQEKNHFFYLLATAKQNPQHWILPKGHIEPGEAPQETAKREVREETGVSAKALGAIGDVHFMAQGNCVKVCYFLMEYLCEAEAFEDREKRWCTYEESLQLLTFDDARDILEKAHQIANRHWGNDLSGLNSKRSQKK